MCDDFAASPMPSIQTGIAAAVGLALEAGMLNATLSDGRPRAALWTSDAAMVVSRRDTLLGNFNDAKTILSREGIPVLVRESGGTAVLQGPGIITLSLVYAPRSPSLEEGYESLRTVAAAAFAPWGIEIGFGAVDGAFCDGKHNLVVGRRKFGGTAQRRRAARFAATLVHAVLLVDVDVEAMTRSINRFYELAGAPRRFSPHACTSLSMLGTVTNYTQLEASAISSLSRATSAWLAET